MRATFGRDLLELALVLRADDLLQDVVDHVGSRGLCVARTGEGDKAPGRPPFRQARRAPPLTPSGNTAPGEIKSASTFAHLDPVLTPRRAPPEWPGGARPPGRPRRRRAARRLRGRARRREACLRTCRSTICRRASAPARRRSSGTTASSGSAARSSTRTAPGSSRRSTRRRACPSGRMMRRTAPAERSGVGGGVRDDAVVRRDLRERRVAGSRGPRLLARHLRPEPQRAADDRSRMSGSSSTCVDGTVVFVHRGGRRSRAARMDPARPGEGTRERCRRELAAPRAEPEARRACPVARRRAVRGVRADRSRQVTTR